MINKLLKRYNVLLFGLTFCCSLGSLADDETRVDEASLQAKPGPIWVYKDSTASECVDVESDQADIVEYRKILEDQSIRVLTFERNQNKSDQKKKCGDQGNFIACFSIFSKDKAKALSLGFKENGNCGMPYKSKSN